MLIDWFTVGAQALNFLILVWLMKRYLYKPILNAIDAREKRIAAELADAAAKQAEANKEHAEFEQKNQEFEKGRTARLKLATDAAEADRQRLLDDARKAADAIRTKREVALQNEQRTLGHDLTRWTQKQVFAIARKTLSDLASASLEERMSEAFVQRLRGLTGAAKEQLAVALKSSTQPVPVRSAFDLPQGQRSAIQNAINETFSADIHIQFETVPELVSGIELSANGQKVAWSIADYLATLEQSADELLHKEAKPEPKAEAKVDSAPKAEEKPEPNAEAKPQPAKPKPEPKPEAELHPKP
jgi:F-type H+-transporting ATPase subunit b